MTLGSLAERSFRELWEGPTATAKRLEHLAGEFKGVCEGCGGINWYETTEAMKSRARGRGVELGLEGA